MRTHALKQSQHTCQHVQRSETRYILCHSVPEQENYMRDSRSRFVQVWCSFVFLMCCFSPLKQVLCSSFVLEGSVLKEEEHTHIPPAAVGDTIKDTVDTVTTIGVWETTVFVLFSW